MTRRVSVRKNVLAARGSFWEALPQVRMALATKGVEKGLESDTTSERMRAVACRTLPKSKFRE